MSKSNKNWIGAWAFLIGVILAVAIGIVGIDMATAWNGVFAVIVVILGVIIGLLNITGSETRDFLFAGTVLVLVSALAGQALVAVQFVGQILQALIALFAPATIIVALKSVFVLARK